MQAQSNFSLDWFRSMGGIQYDQATSLKVDSDNNMYCAGSFSNSMGSSTSHGLADVFLSKYDDLGNLLWTESWGGPGMDHIHCLETNSSQDVIISGVFWDTMITSSGDLIGLDQEDAFVISYSAEGQMNWAKSFVGPGDNAITDLKVDQNGDIVVCGYFEDTLFLDQITLTADNLRAFFVAKMDSNASILWAQKAEGPHYDEGLGLALDPNRNIYVTGHFRDALFLGADTLMGSSSSNEILLISYDALGKRRWVKGMGAGNSDIGYRVCFDSKGSLYQMGWFHQEAFFDQDTLIADHEEGAEIFIAKYDTSGNRLWVKSFGGQHEEYGYAMTIDANDNLIFTGTFDSVFHVGDRDSLYARHSLSATNIFVASIDEHGEWLWAKNMGGLRPDYAYDIDLDHSGFVYLTGMFQDSTIIDADTFYSAGGFDGFLLKLGLDTLSSTTHFNQISTIENLQVAPNPSCGLVHIDISINKAGPLSILLYDMNGRLVQTICQEKAIQVGHHTIPFDSKTVNAGMYCLHIVTNENIQTRLHIIN